MKISLDPMQGYVKNGKFDQYEALKSTGVKAAVCFKEAVDGTAVSQDMIRNLESDATLIRRGLDTIFQDHTTPSEHQQVSLEITGIPKILCMILNNEKQYTADERSLRYTEVEENDYITNLEVRLYRKWLEKLEKRILEMTGDFYFKHNKSEASALKAIHKIAQENARYMVSCFMPTTITYTVPWIQLNKILVYMKRIIDNPMNDFEKRLIPYLEDFINQCKQLDVAITKDSIYNVVESNDAVKDTLINKYPQIEQYKGDKSLLYKNNKDVDLSLFAERNKFSGIELPNCYGPVVSYNNTESIACLAQEHRHRTAYCEMKLLDKFTPVIPPIIADDHALVSEWCCDMYSVQDIYPQGQLVKVNRTMSVKNMLKFVGQERACERAQLEIERVYTNNIIPDVYNGLLENEQYISLANQVKPYVKKLRCQYPGYRCPSPCGHPRLDRIV